MNRRDTPDWEIADGISEAIFGTTAEFEQALKKKAPAAIELQRGIDVRLRTRDREAIDKALTGVADQLEDGLLDLREDMLAPDLVEQAEQFAERLRGWKNEPLFELLHDLQRALTAKGDEKVREARLESLARAVQVVIGYEPPAKPKADTTPVDTKPPEDLTVGEKFRRTMAHAHA